MYDAVKNLINESDGLARHMGIVVESVSSGYAKASMPLGDHNRNGLGNLHGAASFALADMAFAGVALAEGITTVNITSSISFMAAGKAGPIIAEGRLIAESRKLCTIEVNVIDGEGTHVARFTATGYRMGPLPLGRAGMLS